jgi:hypothetical protein
MNDNEALMTELEDLKQDILNILQYADFTTYYCHYPDGDDWPLFAAEASPSFWNLLVARHKQIHDELLVEAMEKQTYVSHRTINELAQSSDWQVREAAIRFLGDSINDAIKQELAMDEVLKVRVAAASKLCLPRETFKKLMDDVDDVQVALLKNVFLDRDLKEELNERGTKAQRLAWAADKATQSDLLARLADDKDEKVKLAALKNPSLPVEIILAKLEFFDNTPKLQRKELSELWVIAGNESLPLKAIHKIVSHSERWSYSAAGRAMERPIYPLELIIGKANSPLAVDRRCAACCNRLPLEDTIRLFYDADGHVRAGLYHSTNPYYYKLMPWRTLFYD